MTQTPRLVNRLKLKHWSLLSALGEAPTLHQAAARIAVTQPAATKMLKCVLNRSMQHEHEERSPVCQSRASRAVAD